MFSLLFGLINLALDLYKLLLVAYFVIRLIKLPENQWTSLLASITEPVLAPVRKLVNQHLPKKWQVCDWSPIALCLLITVVQWVL